MGWQKIMICCRLFDFPYIERARGEMLLATDDALDL